MKNRKATFVLALICAIAAFVVLILNWNAPEKWRYTYSLIGAIIFGIIFLGATYNLFRSKDRK
jgi:FtsH-binding integral membrane protein